MKTYRDFQGDGGSDILGQVVEQRRQLAERLSSVRHLANTRWGARDWLLADLPPGSERLPNVQGLLPGLAGAVVVTLGSPVSLEVVARSVTAAKERDIRVLGLVENMAGHACAGCGHT